MHIVGRKYSAVRWNAQPMFRKIGGRCGQTTSSKRRKRKLGIGGVHPPTEFETIYVCLCGQRCNMEQGLGRAGGGSFFRHPAELPVRIAISAMLTAHKQVAKALHILLQISS